MTAKVSKQSQVVVKAPLKKAVKPPPAEPKPAAQTEPQLSERALRRTGKASGFSRTFAALPKDSQQPVASDAPVMRAGSVATAQQLRGGQIPTSVEDLQKAEGAVANNSGVNREWSMAELKKDPKKFLRDVVQLDGALSSTTDRNACGPTSLLMGMIAGRPESVQELAGKLVANGKLTPAGEALAARVEASMVRQARKTAPPDKLEEKLAEARRRGAEVREELQGAAGRLGSGKDFTPADVTTLANCMQGVESLAGAEPNDLRETALAIAGLGVKLPPLELQLFGKPDGSMGHWRVVSKGTQFNPWPNANGQSTQLPASQGLEAGKKDGAGWVLRDTVRVDQK